MMVGVILMIIFAHCDYLKLVGRLVGAQEPDLARGVARDGEQKKHAAASALHFDPESFVYLFVDQVVRLRGAQDMPIEPVGTLRDFVLNGVEKCAIVGGPGDACDAFDLLGKGTARMEIFYVKRIFAEAGRIGRIGEQLIIVADLEGTQPKKRMSLCKLIEVQQQLFGGTVCIAPPELKGVLLAFLGSGEVQIAAEQIGDREIRLQDAAKQFLVKLPLKSFGGLQYGVRISILCFQVGDNFGVLFMAEPRVMVDAAVAV